MQVGFLGERWRLVRERDGEVLGEIVIDEADFPWLYGRFEPTTAFGAVRPWFEESSALLDAEEYERFDTSYERIAAALSLVAEFLLHIDGGRASFRWSDEPFDES